MDGLTCKRCGTTEEVDVECGFCVDCQEANAYDEAFPPGDNFSTLYDMGLDG
jgi:hypothetical protein